MPGATLEMRGVSKTFGGVHALEGVDLTVDKGQIHGLLGHNGSGKSTLVKILAGYHAPDPAAGEVYFEGRPLPLPVSPSAIHELVGFVHQDLGLVDSLSIWENLFVASYESGPLGAINLGMYRRRAEKLLETFGLDIDPDTIVGDLSDVQKAEVAILRAIGDDAISERRRLLVLDEPTAYLPRADSEQLFNLIRRASSAGVAVVYVSHKLEEVLSICSSVTVLRDGRKVDTRPTADLTEDALIELILGRAISRTGLDSRQVASDAESAVEVSNFTATQLDGVTIEIKPGEIVGVTGLIGSGHEHLPYALFGSIPASGALSILGKTVDLSHWSPPRAIAYGFALVPGNRARDGIAASESVSSNLAIVHVAEFTSHITIRLRSLARWVRSALAAYGVTPPVGDLPVSALSGGNQQKVVLAKWLELKPSVLLLHEPTQGIDVGTKAEVFELLRQAAGGGAAVLISSGEYDELAELCSRVEVMASGRIHRTLVKPHLSGDAIEEEVLRASTAQKAVS